MAKKCTVKKEMKCNGDSEILHEIVRFVIPNEKQKIIN